jgi:hypothetical protein
MLVLVQGLVAGAERRLSLLCVGAVCLCVLILSSGRLSGGRWPHLLDLTTLLEQ